MLLLLLRYVFCFRFDFSFNFICWLLFSACHIYSYNRIFRTRNSIPTIFYCRRPSATPRHHLITRCVWESKIVIDSLVRVCVHVQAVGGEKRTTTTAAIEKKRRKYAYNERFYLFQMKIYSAFAVVDAVRLIIFMQIFSNSVWNAMRVQTDSALMFVCSLRQLCARSITLAHSH